MARIIIDGDRTWGAKSMMFHPGASECYDEDVLDAAERGPKDVWVEWDDSVEHVSAEDSIRIATEPGPMTTPDLRPEFRCSVDGCEETFLSKARLSTHERIRHINGKAVA